MPKRPLTPTEAFDLRQALHVATLDALMTSRRWEPGDLVFQGGTSLHLAHGSPRFSEDLDFLVNSSLKLDSITESIQARLDGTAWIPEDTKLTVGKAKDGHNPHAFVVSIGGPDVIGAVRVKVELWQTAEAALSAVKATVAPVGLARGPAAGVQAYVPTAELPEIYADKVFALAARPYLKPRDVFDLHWLDRHSNLRECTAEELRVRLQTYPNETPNGWLDKAFARRAELKNAGPAIADDLKRWLPSSWPITEATAQEMALHAITSLEQGIDVMREIREHDHDTPEP
jgi:predicted nucleotidyltransferase component of viral defense system